MDFRATWRARCREAIRASAGAEGSIVQTVHGVLADVRPVDALPLLAVGQQHARHPGLFVFVELHESACRDGGLLPKPLREVLECGDTPLHVVATPHDQGERVHGRMRGDAVHDPLAFYSAGPALCGGSRRITVWTGQG